MKKINTYHNKFITFFVFSLFFILSSSVYATNSLQLDQKQISQSNSNAGINNSSDFYQTFTPSVTGNLELLELGISINKPNTGLDNTTNDGAGLRVDIMGTDSSGKPNGVILGSKIVTKESVSSFDQTQKLLTSFSFSNVQLTAGKMYAIHLTSSSSSTPYEWAWFTGDRSVYANGKFYMTTTAVNLMELDGDAVFQTSMSTSTTPSKGPSLGYTIEKGIFSLFYSMPDSTINQSVEIKITKTNDEQTEIFSQNYISGYSTQFPLANTGINSYGKYIITAYFKNADGSLSYGTSKLIDYTAPLLSPPNQIQTSFANGQISVKTDRSYVSNATAKFSLYKINDLNASISTTSETGVNNTNSPCTFTNGCTYGSFDVSMLDAGMYVVEGFYSDENGNASKSKFSAVTITATKPPKPTSATIEYNIVSNSFYLTAPIQGQYAVQFKLLDSNGNAINGVSEDTKIGVPNVNLSKLEATVNASGYVSGKTYTLQVKYLVNNTSNYSDAYTKTFIIAKPKELTIYVKAIAVAGRNLYIASKDNNWTPTDAWKMTEYKTGEFKFLVTSNVLNGASTYEYKVLIDKSSNYEELTNDGNIVSKHVTKTLVDGSNEETILISKFKNITSTKAHVRLNIKLDAVINTINPNVDKVYVASDLSTPIWKTDALLADRLPNTNTWVVDFVTTLNKSFNYKVLLNGQTSAWNEVERYTGNRNFVVKNNEEEVTISVSKFEKH